jgi:hypothetical protein
MPPMGGYKPGRPSLLTMPVRKLAMQQTHAFFVRLRFAGY